jgi:hypothetical protein
VRTRRSRRRWPLDSALLPWSMWLTLFRRMMKIARMTSAC